MGFHCGGLGFGYLLLRVLMPLPPLLPLPLLLQSHHLHALPQLPSFQEGEKSPCPRLLHSQF